jgi:hypothetical protein
VTDSLNRVIWEKSTQADEYFYIENLASSTNTFSFKKVSTNAPTPTLYYSFDKVTWSSYIASTSARNIQIPANSKLYLKCTINSLGNNYGGLTFTNNADTAVGGNILSLLLGDNFSGVTSISTSTYAFSGLFYGNNKLKSVANLVMPATTLANYCYYQMFKNCTALTDAPVLPATTLTNSCYYNMFQGCTALTTAPTLPATTLTTQCYYQMFYDCSSLNSVTINANNISASNCLYYWLYNVAATGTFHNLGTATYTSGQSGIPTGWTEVNS